MLGLSFLWIQSPQDSRGKRAFCNLPFSLCFHKRLASIHFAQKAAGSEQNKSNTQFRLEKFKKEIPIAFRWSGSGLPWVQFPEKTPVRSMILRSHEATDRPIHWGRRTPHFVVVVAILWKSTLTKWAPDCSGPEQQIPELRSLISGKPKRVWGTSEFVWKGASPQLPAVKSNHGHYLLEWYQQTFSCSIRGDLRVVPWGLVRGVGVLNKNQSRQVSELTKGAKAKRNAVPMQLWHNYRDYAPRDRFLNPVSNKLDVIIILLQQLLLYHYYYWKHDSSI